MNLQKLIYQSIHNLQINELQIHYNYLHQTLSQQSIILQIIAQMADGILNSPKLDDEYEVQSIIDRKNTKEGLMYRVKWKGFDLDEATWEPLVNLINSLDCVKQFETKLRQQRKNIANTQELDSSNNSIPAKNKQNKFKEDRIFQKQIKYQDKKKRKEQKKREKIKQINGGIQLKQNKQKQLENNCQQFCVLISEYSQNFQGEQSQQQMQMNNPSQPEYSRNYFKDYLEQSKHNNFPSKLEQFQGDDIDQDESKLILGNLNPHDESGVEKIQFANKEAEDKPLKIKISQSKKRILNEEDPIIRNKNAKINNIFEADGKLFAELKIKHKTKGVVDFQILKKQKQTLKIQAHLLQNLIKPK